MQKNSKQINWERYKSEKIADIANVVASLDTCTMGDVTSFVRFLINYRRKQGNSLSTYQLQALALLTGYIDNEIQEAHHFDPNEYQQNNFLNRNNPLFLLHCDRNLLCLQMVLRVVYPHFIDQRNQEVCGPTTFLQIVAQSDPVAYLQFIIELAEAGEAKVKSTSDTPDAKSQLKINIHDLKDYEPRAKRKSSTNLCIHEVDYIGLVGLRCCANRFIKKPGMFGKQLFGVTLPGRIKQWMEALHCEEIEQITLNNEQDIRRCQLFLEDGYQVSFLTTSSLANALLYADQNSAESKVGQLLEGHFVQIHALNILDSQGQIEIEITTWGERKWCQMRLDRFMELKGPLARFIMVRPEINKHALYATEVAKLPQNPLAPESFEIKTPFLYCSNTRSYVSNLSNAVKKAKNLPEPILALTIQLEDTFRQAARHENNLDWVQAAKRIQNSILRLKIVSEGGVDSQFVQSTISDLYQHCFKNNYVFNNVHERDSLLDLLQKLEEEGNKENVLRALVANKQYLAVEPLLKILLEEGKDKLAYQLIKGNENWLPEAYSYQVSRMFLQEIIKKRPSDLIKQAIQKTMDETHKQYLEGGISSEKASNLLKLSYLLIEQPENVALDYLELANAHKNRYKKIAGAMLMVLGALVFVASTVLAVATLGSSVPISAFGVSVSSSLLSYGVGLATTACLTLGGAYLHETADNTSETLSPILSKG